MSIPSDRSSRRQRFLENLPGVVLFGVLGVLLVSAITGVGPTGLIAVVGFAVLLPLAGILSHVLTGSKSEAARSERARDRREEATDAADELQTLRTRYARGELTDEEFERRVEDLLATDSLETARESVEHTPSGIDQEGTSTETEAERE